MLVTPLPGVDRTHLHQVLRKVHTDVMNQESAGPIGYDKRLLGYLEWASSAVEQLGSLIRPADLDRLVLTKRYGQLLAGVGSLTSGDTQRLTNSLVSLELRQRKQAFEQVVEAFAREMERWDHDRRLVIPDTSFYIHHPEKLEKAEFPGLLGGGSVHLIVPMVIIDELDGLKEKGSKHARWRARYTLAVIDRLFQGVSDEAVLNGSAAEVSSAVVTVGLLLDPPGHRRLPIEDDEIVDSGLAVKALAGHQVTVLTYDTGQATRARMAGLGDVKLQMEVGEEPEQADGDGVRKRRS